MDAKVGGPFILNCVGDGSLLTFDGTESTSGGEE